MLHLYQDTPIGGGDALYAMSDVNINNPEDGQMLIYDAQTQRWRNVTQKSLNDLAEVTDLTDIIATGTTNATGSTIPKGTFFYLNDDLCQAKADIASGATFTLNTNYEEVTAGGLNALNSKIAHTDYVDITVTSGQTYRQVLNALYALADTTKINANSYVTQTISGGYVLFFKIVTLSTSQFNFMWNTNSTYALSRRIVLEASNSIFSEASGGNTTTDKSTTSATVGDVFELHY